jgi:hypothetical protein
LTGSNNPDHDPSDSFLAGSSAPDAFKLFSTEPKLHSLPFAAALHDFAKQQTNSSGSPDALDFALGFGCHVAEDMVGHHAQGYLNPKTDHPLEAATDAYAVRAGSMPFKQISKEMCTLVVQASAAAGGSIQPITQSSGSSAVLKFRALTTTEAGTIAVDLSYKSAMQKDSFCNVSSFDAVRANFELATNWSQLACSRWQALMRSNSSHGNTSGLVAEMAGFVDDLFAKNGDTSCVAQK